ENNSTLEARGDGLAPDLDEGHRPIERDRRVVADGDVQGESELIPTRKAPHRGLEARPTESATPALLRPSELRDERTAHPVRVEARAHDPIAVEGNLRRPRHDLTGIA